jgi:hypothetical protein
MVQVPRSVRPLVLLSLFLASFAPLTAQASSRLRGQQPEEARPRSQRQLAPSLLPLLWRKVTCIIDPHGACASSLTPQSSAQCQGESALGLDPHGQCSDGR